MEFTQGSFTYIIDNILFVITERSRWIRIRAMCHNTSKSYVKIVSVDQFGVAHVDDVYRLLLDGLNNDVKECVLTTYYDENNDSLGLVLSINAYIYSKNIEIIMPLYQLTTETQLGIMKHIQNNLELQGAVIRHLHREVKILSIKLAYGHTE